jgi:adenosine tuberculosinyltransferase
VSSPELAEWLSWPSGRIAQWITDRGRPIVMGWPFNGTRRWYLIHRRENPEADDYLTTIIRRQAELHRMVFAHGVSVVVAPGFGTELLTRGSTYTNYILGGLLQLADDAVYQEMFAAGIRIRFYGDYEEVLDTPSLRPLLRACARLTAATESKEGPLLLIGLFADTPYQTLARLSVEFARKEGYPPNRQQLIEAYYGLAVPDLSLYLGFAQTSMFDAPLLATGQEDLYATLAPSPSLTERQLREILYDHLVTRPTPEISYEGLSDEAKDALADYNKRYSGATLGIGHIDPLTGIWNPSLPYPSTPTRIIET